MDDYLSTSFYSAALGFLLGIIVGTVTIGSYFLSR